MSRQHKNQITKTMKQKLFTSLLTVAFLASITIWITGCKKDNENSLATEENQSGLRVANQNSFVYPPVANMFGKSYTQWGVDFWKWEIASDCGSIFGGGPQTQLFPDVYMLETGGGNVTIPSSKAILITIGSVINDYACPDTGFHPEAGETLEHFLTRGAIEYDGAYSNHTLIIDGNTIAGLSSYHVVSSMFDFIGNPDLANCVDPCVTGGVQQGVVAGTFVMIKPFAPGTHTIHFSLDYAGVTYSEDYIITSN